MEGPILTGLLLTLFFVLKVSGQELAACEKSGDYLWKKSSANRFFYCYRIGHAMAMKCQDDRVMCKVEGNVFAPCMCKKGQGDKVFYDSCKEEFRLVPDMDRAGGKVVKDATTSELCAKDCLRMIHCLAYSFTRSISQCRIFLPKKETPELEEMSGVDYYEKKACALKLAYKQFVLSSGNMINQSAITAAPVNVDTPTPDQVSKSPKTGLEPVEGKEADDTNDHNNYTPETPMATTTTIPDTGCPYGLEKFEGRSQRNGIELKHISDIETCKSWCLHHGYCKGIDFNMELNACFWHRVIDELSKVYLPNVWHIRKLTCQPPLKCWSQISYNSSNVDPSTPQIPCQGVCFVREKIFKSYSVFERGCHASGPPHHVGCEVDGALTGLTCFCDTDRCNGLSISAIAALMLHLPLDDDGADHSGLSRNGQAALGFTMPKVSCLEKAINCSMVFNGQQCIEVAQMASQAWGEVNLNNEFTGMFTVSVWFMSAQSSPAEVQGITGNSWDAAVTPTWAIQTSNISKHIVTAGIATDKTKPFTPDFPYIVAEPNMWNHIAVTYDATYNPEENEFPTVRTYLNGVEVPGNMHSDMGNILVRRQPVTVGCVMGKGFVGYIDDLRIFATALGAADIQALLQMYDSLYI